MGGIPPRPGSRGAFAPPPLGPRAARPAPLREDGAALSGQCAGLRAWSAGGRWGLQAATPSSAPCPGTVGRRAQRSRLRSAAESALVGAAAAASRQVGARAEGRPSGPHAQPAVVARPGSLRPGRRELGCAARGLSLAGGGRAGRGAARPGARSLIGGASGQGAGSAGGMRVCLVAPALCRSSPHRRLLSLPTMCLLWRNVLRMQGDVSYHPCPFRARGNCCTREDCYGRISHGISREHRKGAVNP